VVGGKSESYAELCSFVKRKELQCKREEDVDAKLKVNKTKTTGVVNVLIWRQLSCVVVWNFSETYGSGAKAIARAFWRHREAA
jgi:hypothetical protein